MAQRATQHRELAAVLDSWEQEWSSVASEVKRVRALLAREEKEHRQSRGDGQLGKLLNSVERSHGQLSRLMGQFKALGEDLRDDQFWLGGTVDQLIKDTRKAFMLPFSTLLEVFPKLVRDLSRDQGKEVDLSIQGSEIEINRRILEQMKDPLIHIVHNCIDHGLEKPEERARSNKPRRGAVTINVSQIDSRTVELAVADDGRGMDMAKIRSAAVKAGHLAQEEAEKLTEQQTLSLILESGVSTSQTITDISGRGLGLAIAAEVTEKLGGRLSVETKPHVGSCFRFLLPLTVATFRGVLVKAADRLFVVPVANAEQSLRIKPDEVKTVENRETIPLHGSVVSLVRLADVLELPQKEREQEDLKRINVLVLSAGGRRIGFSVDAILGEQEVLSKVLGRHLFRVRNIGGATVLGSGKVVPILNVPDLMKSAVLATRLAAGAPADLDKVKKEEQAILLAEDSITARTLLKNILESAGYSVKTAVDGAEALAALKTGEFHLVVSDVQMPRMDGFVLTAKIRSDKRLADTPVVLVTSLDSREDRERGVDAGANAYIVKSSFDQSNLLAVIRQLI